MLFIGQKDTHQPITNAVTGSSITQTIFNRMTRLATLSMVFTVMQQFFLILAESGHSDRNGGILLKNRKNSAKIGMVGSYGVAEAFPLSEEMHFTSFITCSLHSLIMPIKECNEQVMKLVNELFTCCSRVRMVCARMLPGSQGSVIPAEPGRNRPAANSWRTRLPQKMQQNSLVTSSHLLTSVTN